MRRENKMTRSTPPHPTTASRPLPPFRKKRGGYSSGPKSVSELKPPPTGVAPGVRIKHDDEKPKA